MEKQLSANAEARFADIAVRIKNLVGVGSPDSALSLRDLLEALLDVANLPADASDARLTEALAALGASLPIGDGIRGINRCRERVDWFRRGLETARRGDEPAAALLASQCDNAAARVILSPYRRGGAIRYRVFAGDCGALFAFGLLLLLDPEYDFGRQLCRCRLEACRRFFFEIRGESGRPRRSYCCDEHMETIHAQTAARRVARSRARRRREATEA